MKFELIDKKSELYNPMLVELGIHSISYRADYVDIDRRLRVNTRLKDEDSYLREVREVTEDDFWAFCFFILALPVNHPFLIARCYDLQDGMNMTFDGWPREHFKSTLITYAYTLWELCRNSELRFCIFSYERARAYDHMDRNRQAMETNEVLKRAYYDVFYEDPERQAPKWTNKKLYVKRRGTYKEASIEGYSLLKLPTGNHYDRLIWDDAVEMDHAFSPAKREKSIRYFNNAQHCGSRGDQKRVTGTFYHYQDLHCTMREKKTTVEVNGEKIELPQYKFRIFPAEVNEKGEAERGGTPIYLTRAELDKKFYDSGPVDYSYQMLLKVVKEGEMKFDEKWVRYYDALPRNLNLYLIVDAASTKKTKSDYSAFSVLGTSARIAPLSALVSHDVYLVDLVRDRLSLNEKWIVLKKLMTKYNLMSFGLEKYSQQDFMQYLQERMDEDHCYYSIIPLGDNKNKEMRIINNLFPKFTQGKIFFPRELQYRDVNGKQHELIGEIVTEELLRFPNGKDDVLDTLTYLMTDAKKMGVVYPFTKEEKKVEKKKYNPLDTPKRESSMETMWM